jgi:hypothetical protein
MCALNPRSMIAIAIGVYVVIFVAVLGLFCAANKGKPWPLPESSDLPEDHSTKLSMDVDRQSEPEMSREREGLREEIELRSN